ncbi:MAG TPA: hypothetical protein PKL36_13830, partial [Agitococcus sp.]|nr:hypothetical protein [Agitococcus sp.]
QLFEAAKIAKFTPVERQVYEDSLKYYRDLKNVTDTARGEGFEEGKEEGIEIGKEIGKEEGKAEGMAIGEQKGIAIAAIGMHKAGLSVELIAKSLSLAESVVLELLKEA